MERALKIKLRPSLTLKLKRASSLALLLGRGAEKRVQQTLVRGSEEPFNAVTSYGIGAYLVSIVESGGKLEYVVLPVSELEEMRNAVSKKLDDIVLLLIKGNDPGDILSAVLKVPRNRVADALYVLRTLTGYGKLQVLLDDPYIQDISAEGPGRIWIRHSLVEALKPEQDFLPTNIYLSSVEEVVTLQQIIATKCNTYISTSNPIVDAQLPTHDGGHRAHLVFPTISQSRPEIVIRKRLPQPPRLDQLVDAGVLPRAVADLFSLVIRGRGSIVIAGPPGSGKTTLLRSVLYSLTPKTWKVIVIEDTGEIDPPAGSPWTRYTAFELGAVRVDLFDLAKASLRSSGTRLIVVGETRGAEAQVLSQALLVGLGALTTFHGSSPEEVIARLMSPPIGLTQGQIGMFHYIAVMGFGEKPRRQLKLLSELVYSASESKLSARALWRREQDGLNTSLEDLVSRSARFNELKARLEAPQNSSLRAEEG
ncbi:MAG: type II/IV secretion system ATPase subunit [Desulfurococcaceae archaeon]